MVDENVPVLIVGGSLVGLSTAVFLGHHGISSLVVERHRGTAIHPRAALVSQRTVEAYRARRPSGRGRGGSRPGVRPERRDHVGGEPRRERARLVLPVHQRGSRGAEPVAAALRHADRARAGPPPGRAASRRADRICGRGCDGGAGRGRRDRDRAAARRRPRPYGARPLSHRCGRGAQPDAESGSASGSSVTGASRTASRSTSRPTCAP